MLPMSRDFQWSTAFHWGPPAVAGVPQIPFTMTRNSTVPGRTWSINGYETKFILQASKFSVAFHPQNVYNFQAPNQQAFGSKDNDAPFQGMGLNAVKNASAKKTFCMWATNFVCLRLPQNVYLS